MNLKMTITENKYISWLKKRGVRLFEGGGTKWILYQGALVPALPFPAYYEPSTKDAKLLLKASGAWFIRYSTKPCDYKTPWWYVLCDHYDPKNLNATARRYIRRGKRECTVREVDAEWMAANGYSCYAAAFERYRGLKPVLDGDFKKMILDTLGGPFSYWAVFHEENLAGFCQCIIEGEMVSTSLFKYHPSYLKHRSAYALVDQLIQTYVVGKGMTLSNGNRSVVHKTKYQDVLISIGFRRQFCMLKIVYKPWLKFCLDSLYPLRPLIGRLPDFRFIQKIKSLQFQDDIRRASDRAI